MDILNLVQIKLLHCKHVVSILQGFLESFQTYKPMITFLSTSLEQVRRRFTRKFVSPGMISKTKHTVQAHHTGSFKEGCLFGSSIS